MIEEQKNEAVPAHEMDLWIDCPIKYYFYKYVFYQPYWEKKWKTNGNQYKIGSRLYIPDYMPDYIQDYRIGKIPQVLKKVHFPSIGHKFISEFIEPYVKNQTDDIDYIRYKLSKVSIKDETKDTLKRLIDFIEDKRNHLKFGKNGDGWNYNDSNFLDMIRSPILHFPNKKYSPAPKNQKYLSLSRYKYSFVTVQNSGFNFINWIPDKNIYNDERLYVKLIKECDPDDIKSWPLRKIFDKKELYKSVEAKKWVDIVLKMIIHEIKEFNDIEGNREIKLTWKKGKCEDCVYKRLCGYWEVL